MIRQRVQLRASIIAQVARLLTVALGLALAWYGLMVVMLAVKISPRTVNDISAYRTVYDWAARLTARDFTTAVSLIAGFGGLLMLLVFLAMAVRQLPRPYMARGDVDISRDAPGATIVNPRAVERVAELAANRNQNVTSSSARLGDRELSINVAVKRPAAAASTLTDVQTRVAEDLHRHELPELSVNVILTTLDRNHRRDPS